MEDSMLSLLEVHHQLGSLFEDHQVALVDRDLQRARRLLERFARDIRTHIRHEEDVLLPVYEKRVRYGRLGHPDHLRDEHRQIQESLQGLEERTAGLDEKDPELGRALVALISDHVRFKQLLEHHNVREDRTLYPLLDQNTSPEERRELLAAGAATYHVEA